MRPSSRVLVVLLPLACVPPEEGEAGRVVSALLGDPAAEEANDGCPLDEWERIWSVVGGQRPGHIVLRTATGECGPRNLVISGDDGWNYTIQEDDLKEIAGSELHEIDEPRVLQLANNAPEGFERWVVDTEGRVLGTDLRSLVRWSPEHGWRTLFMCPPLPSERVRRPLDETGEGALAH